MEESGLWFCATRTPVATLFRLVTKQEFDGVGVIIPGSALAPSQAACVNLITGKISIKPMCDVLSQGKIGAMGFRRLVRLADARMNRTRESNLRLFFQKLAEGAHEDPYEAEFVMETANLMLGKKTKIGEKLKAFVTNLEITAVPGKICMRVLEEVNAALNPTRERIRADTSASADVGGPVETTPHWVVLSALFRSWFCGGEIADLLTTLTVGKSSDFQPLSYTQVEKGEGTPGGDDTATTQIVAAILSTAVADREVAERLRESRLAGFCRNGDPPRDAASATGLEPTFPAKLLEKVSTWASNTVKTLMIPELPVVDLSPLLACVDLQAPRSITRSCIVTTRPTAKICLDGDVIIDRSGFGLNFLTQRELELLDLELSQSSAIEDQRLRTLVAQKLSS